MTSRTSITILRPRDEVERLWRDPQYHPDEADLDGLSVRFVEAPGDRGTEVHVEFEAGGTAAKLGEAVQKLRGAVPLAKVKDGLRHFKQRVETGEVARSEAVPEGESLERKFKRRPAQPLREDELSKAVG